MSLVQTGIKKYPMPTVKYTAGSLILWACFSAGGPGHLVQMHGIMDSIKYQQIKNQNLIASVRNLKMGHVLIRAVVKSTFVESKTSPSPKRFESESRPSPKRFESKSRPSPKRFESK